MFFSSTVCRFGVYKIYSGVLAQHQHHLFSNHHRMRLFFTLFFLLATVLSFGQAAPRLGSLKGAVQDSLLQKKLHGATVVLMQPADSSLVAFAATDTAGNFLLKNVAPGPYRLEVSYAGYAAVYRAIRILPADAVTDAGTIALLPHADSLEGVVVTRPPVTMREDTVEFSASAFKTPPNATAEDLVKRLPGMEVDREGNVQSQGEPVTRIYVDGKVFFSNDPKVALKNLNADMIESIQVFEDMSEEARFTKIDDGSRIRTINIKLKKDKKKGIFGRATAGYGNADRYGGNLAANYFTETHQLSVLAGANNVNSPGFTEQDLQQSLGNNANAGANRSDVTANRNSAGVAVADANITSRSGGINYNGKWGKKWTTGISFFTGQTDRVVDRQSLRQNFFTNDSASAANTHTWQQLQQANQTLTARLEYQIDSMNSLLITPALRWGNQASHSYDTVSTLAISKLGAFLAIAGSNTRQQNSSNFNFSNNVLFRHRFSKPGRSFTIGWSTGAQSNEGDGFNIAPYTFFYVDSTIRRRQNINQQNLQEGSAFNNTISTSVTESIGTGKLIELNYAHTINQSISDRKTYDYNSATLAYDKLNKPLTNYFENTFTGRRIGANFRVKQKKYNYQVGGAVQFATLESMSRQAILPKDSLLEQQFINFFPNASFNYNPGSKKSLRFNYRGNTRAPNISQLQNILDVSNPTRWRTGNPDLKQEFTHQLGLVWNTMNPASFLYFNANLQANLTGNRIVNSIDTVSAAVQLFKPENVNGAHNFSLSATMGIPLKKMATGKRSPTNLNLTTTLRYGRDVSLLYKKVNYNYSYMAGQRIAFTYHREQKLDINLYLQTNYFNAQYTVQQQMQNRYLDSRYGLDATCWLKPNLLVNNDFEWLSNTGRSDGFNRQIPLWHLHVSYLFLKNKRGALKFSAIDLLNQSQSINRNVGENFIFDSQTEVLQRYFMLSFSLSLSRWGGKKSGNTLPALKAEGKKRPGVGKLGEE